jgi:hypothetical protein
MLKVFGVMVFVGVVFADSSNLSIFKKLGIYGIILEHSILLMDKF